MYVEVMVANETSQIKKFNIERTYEATLTVSESRKASVRAEGGGTEVRWLKAVVSETRCQYPSYN